MPGIGIGSSSGGGGVAIPTVPTALVNGKVRTTAQVGDAVTVFFPSVGLTAPTQQARRNTTAISGATGHLYTVTGFDAETSLTVTGTGLDGATYTTAAVAVGAAPPALATLNPDGTISVEGASEPIRFTVSAPASYAGDYRVLTADLPAIATIDGGANDGLQKVFAPTGISRAGATLTSADPLWVTDDANTDPVTVTRQWKAAGVNITGATGLTWVVDYKDVNFASGDVAITVEHKLVQGAVTRTYTTTAYTLVKPMVERIGKFKVDVTSTTTTPTCSAHLYGFEKALIAYGPGQLSTSLTVGGSAATQIAQTSGGANGQRITLYEFNIATPSDANIVATLATSGIQNVFGVWGVNGTIVSTASATTIGGSTTLSRTPTNATNAVIAMAIGRSNPDVTVTGADSQEVLEMTSEDIFAYAGVIKNAPLSAQAVTFTLTDRAGMALVLVEPTP